VGEVWFLVPSYREAFRRHHGWRQQKPLEHRGIIEAQELTKSVKGLKSSFDAIFEIAMPEQNSGGFPRR